ncbi:NADPH-dependent F420 reductase [Streptomyces sp. NPDC059697]|uniref:NADPH-dependent F420 reductase n=1 Tax=Streptomyces sp. NPDC059697 TaxID=3346912 RepID=UPI00367D9056
MTSIGILGAGRVGASLAGKLAAAGHHVILGRQNPKEQTGAPTEDINPRISFSDQRTATRTADIVINATPGDSALDRLTDLRTELAGKILVDVSNATRDADGLPGDLCYPGSSLAEQLQAALPDTRVVKTLNTMLFMVMTAPEILATPPTAAPSGATSGCCSGPTACWRWTVPSWASSTNWPTRPARQSCGCASTARTCTTPGRTPTRRSPNA